VGPAVKHFPSLDELVPACGELIFAISCPPSLEEAPQIFADTHFLEERIGCLVSEFYDFYERGEPYLEIDIQSRKLPAVQEWLAHMRATREGFAREALRPLEPDEDTGRALGALIDFPLFKSLRLHDLAKAEAEGIVRSMLLWWIAQRRDGR
jgi:hypothetical protein